MEMDQESKLQERERKSKSQMKREMLALQALGEELVSLRPDQTDSIEMPEELRDAVRFARSLKKTEARRRHMQYIGTLMRGIPPEPIREALEAIRSGRTAEAERFQEIERWRTELMEGGSDLLERLVQGFPHADRHKLRQLVTSARKEREGHQPPKASRALFRYLREISRPS